MNGGRDFHHNPGEMKLVPLWKYINDDWFGDYNGEDPGEPWPLSKEYEVVKVLKNGNEIEPQVITGDIFLNPAVQGGTLDSQDWLKEIYAWLYRCKITYPEKAEWLRDENLMKVESETSSSSASSTSLWWWWWTTTVTVKKERAYAEDLAKAEKVEDTNKPSPVKQELVEEETKKEVVDEEKK